MKPLSDLLQRVARTIERHCMLSAGQTIGVAVSGGADSVCLLHVLVEAAPRWDLRLAVLHLDHRLRGAESAQDAEFVRALAERLGLPIEIRAADLAVGDNLEQAARRARLAFYHEMIERGAVWRVATGHTRSDQAETVLFRFLRGAGAAGLAGIRPVSGGRIIRPLLEVDRSEVERYLRERGISWRDDSSNASPRFARNRIRHEMLPLLAREWNPGIVETLAHTAEWARAEEEWWDNELDRLSEGCLHSENGAVLLRSDILCRLPVAAARRVVRRAIAESKGDLRRIDFGHVTRLVDLAAPGQGSGRLNLPGLTVVRSFNWVRFVKSGLRLEPYRVEVTVPGIFRIPGSDAEICLELIEKAETSDTGGYVYNSEMACLDWQRLPGSLVLRNWRAGDRYQPVNSPGEQKIKTLFQRARIPSWERASWPVLTAGSTVVWARRFGPAAGMMPQTGAQMILRVRETRGNRNRVEPDQRLKG